MTKTRTDKLESFIDWWDRRRIHWATAFKNNDVASHSLSESGNNKIARKGAMKGAPIDDCIRYEICQSMKHVSKLKGLRDGTYKGGRGPSRPVLQERDMKFLEKRIIEYPTTKEEANDMVVDILKQLGLPYLDMMNDDSELESGVVPLDLLSEDISKKQPENFVVDVTSSHKFEKKENKHQKPGRPRNSRKRKIGLNDSFELSDFDEESMVEISTLMDGNERKRKLHGTFKKMPANWLWMMNKVDEMPGNYEVSKNSDVEYIVKKLTPAGNSKVTFGADTGCTCDDFELKFREAGTSDPARKMVTINCKHIIFVMQSLGIDVSKNLLARKHHLC